MSDFLLGIEALWESPLVKFMTAMIVLMIVIDFAVKRIKPKTRPNPFMAPWDSRGRKPGDIE